MYLVKAWDKENKIVAEYYFDKQKDALSFHDGMIQEGYSVLLEARNVE
jgi:hypothetical protein